MLVSDPSHVEAGTQAEAEDGRFSYEGLDRVIHERARLSVLTSLVAHPRGLAFPDLKRLCGLTDGNLSRHLAVLQEGDLVSLEKGYDHNRPQTLCRLTGRGRVRFLDYLAVLEQVVRDAAKATGRGSGREAAKTTTAKRTSLTAAEEAGGPPDAMHLGEALAEPT